MSPSSFFAEVPLMLLENGFVLFFVCWVFFFNLFPESSKDTLLFFKALLKLHHQNFNVIAHIAFLVKPVPAVSNSLIIFSPRNP